MGSSLRILLVSAEVAPLAKVGGLADVAGALPKALCALGHDVRVAMPAYRMVEDAPGAEVRSVLPSFSIPIAEGICENAWVHETNIGDGVPVYLVGHDRYFRDATESKRIYTLEPDPYIFFNRAVVEMVPRLPDGWTPDIVHCNDWQAGLIPAYIDAFWRAHPAWRNAACVYTIHNLAHQGNFDYDVFRRTGLPGSLFHFERLEFYGQMSFMKSGLVYADMVNTVSRTYAREIQTAEYGCGMDGVLAWLSHRGRLKGIVNGIDYEEYDPETDPRIAAHFSATRVAGKARCKAALQTELGLPRSKRVPLIGVVSRLADQKGFDLIHAITGSMMAQDLQFVVLGMGDPSYERFFTELERNYPRKARARIEFDADLAQRIYAGCDLFLMPSRFEPCGLGQLMSLRYGTLPIVRATGGLADTIVDVKSNTGKGNGFVFTRYEPEALLKTLERSLTAYHDPASWAALVERALASDFSWTVGARKYVELYGQARSARRLAAAA